MVQPTIQIRRKILRLEKIHFPQFNFSDMIVEKQQR